MKKIAVAIAHKEALPEAFVVFRGFEENIPLAADLGYNGVELALRRADEIDGTKIAKLLSKANMEVSAISTLDERVRNSSMSWSSNCERPAVSNMTTVNPPRCAFF